jgi:mono/diheme cytochrome c family protein
MSYKDDARIFLEKAGIDPDIFDWDIAEIMADFAAIKVGEATSEQDCPACHGSDKHCKVCGM